MASESGCEGGEAKKGAPSSLVNEEPVSGHQSPPAGTPADLEAPKCLKDTKDSPTQVDLQSIPKVLDPRTLQLPLGQWELEIKALRCAIQDRQDARHCRILREVAGLPPERGLHSQDKFLQTQIQKLTLELKEQKGRAQLERERLEEQLLRTQTLLEQREAELQALHKSCLLRLAHSSWVGRMLRSSTGSVEVVTAETLMDPSDSSENDEVSPAREGFRLEDVDWNIIAHRYPNLLANIKSNSDYNWRLDERSGVQKVTGHPPRSLGHISFQHIESPARSFSKDSNAEPEGPPEQEISPDSCETHSDQPGKAAAADHGPSVRSWSETTSCLNIVAVSLSQGFVCILNKSAEETADLGGSTLQQLSGGFPVRAYRFPPHTLLRPWHHITVWGERPGCSKKQPGSPSVGREPEHFHPSPRFVTVLLSPKGEVLSEYRAPHCLTPASRVFDDTDLSIDRFLFSEAQPRADARQQRRPPRLLRKVRRPEARAQSQRPRTQALSRCSTTGKLFSPQEVPAPPQSVETQDAGRLPPVIAQDGLSLTVYQPKTEPTVRVCRKSVDQGCPMVALSVQSRVKNRFCLPGCPPITVDTCRRV